MVYIVIRFYYDDQSILEVFANKTVAESYMKQQEQLDPHYGYLIIERELQ
jgi:hypothetical protein